MRFVVAAKYGIDALLNQDYIYLIDGICDPITPYMDNPDHPFVANTYSPKIRRIYPLELRPFRLLFWRMMLLMMTFFSSSSFSSFSSLTSPQIQRFPHPVYFALFLSL